MRQSLRFLQQDWRVQILRLVLALREESHPRGNVDHLVGVDVDRVEYLLLHRKHVEVAQGLQMPAIVAGRVGKLRECGDEECGYRHVLSIEGVVSVAEENEADRHVDCHAEAVMKHLRVLELLPDDPHQFERLDVAAAGHHDGEREDGGAQQRKELVLVDRVFVEGVVGELALGDLDSLEMFDVVANDAHHCLAARARVPQRECDDRASYHCQVDGGDGLVVDLRDVVDQVVALVDLVERVFVDEADQLWDLAEDELAGGGHGVPHDQVLGHSFEQDVIGIALLDGIEAVGNGDAAGQFRVVGLEVHEGNGEEGRGRSDVQVDCWAFLYA